MINQLYGKTVLTDQVNRCLLCSEGGCSKACPNGVPIDNILRSVKFDNLNGAVRKFRKYAKCIECDSLDCMKNCIRNKIGDPVNIREIIKTLSVYDAVEERDVDISVKFCGIDCENPFFLSSSVVSKDYEMVARAFRMGWAGAALKTIAMFESEDTSPRFSALKMGNSQFMGFKNIEQLTEKSVDENLECIRKLKREFPQKVIIASIMGRNENEWKELSSRVTQAGADIIECNFSCPHMSEEGLGSDIGQDPNLVEKYTRTVVMSSGIPVIAKMTPNISNVELSAIAAKRGGAYGIAAINTIKSVMNVDPYTFCSEPNVDGKTSVGGYSGKAIMPIALRFIYDLKNCSETKDMPLSGMGGIETWKDALEFILLGCENIQITTAVMQYGYRIIEDLVDGLKLFLSSTGYHSISELVGKALPYIVPAENLDRKSVCYPKFLRKSCVGCGRCVISCTDGGHQAIVQDKDTSQPILLPEKCVGCHLCVTVCPVKAIEVGTRKE